MRGVCESCGAATNMGNALCCKCAHPKLSPAERSAKAKESARVRWGVPRERRKPPPGYISPSKRGTCSRCGKAIQLTRTSAPEPVCQPCRKIAPAAYRAKPGNEPQAYSCALCGREFSRHARDIVNDHPCCSQSCSAKLAIRLGLMPQTLPKALGDRATRKAARSRQRHQVRAETWDGVTDEQIMERDRWRCGICGKRIGKSFRYPHPRSKSIDHVIPISQGGDDKAPNKRAAHLGCNNGRCNRGGGEQLAMIG